MEWSKQAAQAFKAARDEVDILEGLLLHFPKSLSEENVQSAVTMSKQDDKQDGVEQAGSPSFQGSAGRGGHFGGPAASLPKVAALRGTDVQSAVTMSKQDTKAYEVDQEGRSLQASVGSGETYSASVNVTTQDVRGPIKNKHTCGLHDCHGHGHGHCHGKIVVPVQTDVVKDHG